MDFLWNTLSLMTKKVNEFRRLAGNMNKLKRKYEELNCQKEDVESKMKMEVKPGKKLKKEVELWLSTVQMINDEKQRIENDVASGRYLERFRLCKLIAEKIQEVEDLHQKGMFSDSLVVDAPPQCRELLPTTKLGGETTAKKNMEEIRACLISDDIRKIGIYGMGGSGKTTIMKHINNRILEETAGKYDSVIWVTVSKAFNVTKLQNDIANALKEDISRHEDATTRAAKLFAILRGMKRYVLILDDMWDTFHLEDVGIPEPTLDNECKLVLTTRSFDVCRNMNCKGIQIELLSKEEAWKLFMDKVGHDVLLTSNIETTVKLVVQECARLPLAIITIAGSMKGVVDEHEWRNALDELKEFAGGLNDVGKILEQLKYSYIRLKDKKLRQCLLYCALYPEDYEIERKELIEYLIVEGIIEGTSRQAEFDKGHSLLNKLENACLLESVTNFTNAKCVKMHDLIRDMALQIMGCGCMVEAGVKLRDLPKEEQWTENLERVSLMNNYISAIPSRTSPRCSKLSTLLLLKSGLLTWIPGSFFVKMCGLKVLDLSYTYIENLPHSISDLENLTALLLRRCWDLKYVPSLAKLKALRTLDLYCTRIEKVPEGMEMLVKLRYLNLYAEHLNILPDGILPKLSCLQYLIVWWGSETLKVKGAEAVGLRMLETFACQFYDLHDFNTYARSLQGEGPRKYLLLVGPRVTTIDFDEEGSFFSKYVILRKCCISKGGEDPLVLPKDVEELEIEDCHDARSLCDVSSLENATESLRFCKILNCDGMECVLSSSFSSSSSSSSSSYNVQLPSLEILQLSWLRNLRFLCKEGEGVSPPPPGTFSCLKVLNIRYCLNIKKLFTPGLLPHIQNLEELYVRHCEQMEEIIAVSEGEAEEEEEEQQQGMNESSDHPIVNFDYTSVTITLPKLRILSLWGLTELKSIVCYRGIMVCDSLQEITVYRCQKLKRFPLSLPMLDGQLPSPPPSLQKIRINDEEWWESLEWDHPHAKYVLQPCVRFIIR